MSLLDRIEKHLKQNHISATRFGRRAVGDPRFVLDLRMGRRPRRRTIERLEAYLKSIEAAAPDCILKNAVCARKVARGDARRPATISRRPARQPGPTE